MGVDPYDVKSFFLVEFKQGVHYFQFCVVLFLEFLVRAFYSWFVLGKFGERADMVDKDSIHCDAVGINIY